MEAAVPRWSAFCHPMHLDAMKHPEVLDLAVVDHAFEETGDF